MGEPKTTSTHLGKRAFYTKDMAKRSKAAQRTPLPPRCAECRLPGNLRHGDEFYCETHYPMS